VNFSVRKTEINSKQSQGIYFKFAVMGRMEAGDLFLTDQTYKKLISGYRINDIQSGY
jgi:hypothetical protein